MQIKKISEKLTFDVEAQDKCPHGKTRLNTSCSSDCSNTTWSGNNALLILLSGTAWKQVCKKKTTYSCSTSHLL